MPALQKGPEMSFILPDSSSNRSRRSVAPWLELNQIRAVIDKKSRSLKIYSKIRANGRQGNSSIILDTIGTASIKLIIQNIAEELPELLPEMLDILAVATKQYHEDLAAKIATAKTAQVNFGQCSRISPLSLELKRR